MVVYSSKINIIDGFLVTVFTEEVFMNKSEFTRAYAERLGGTIKEAEIALSKLIDTLTECMINGEYVHISGFATFSIKDKNAREGVNPLNSEKIVIPACKSPTVKFSKSYKEIFNQ